LLKAVAHDGGVTSAAMSNIVRRGVWNNQPIRANLLRVPYCLGKFEP
jgi:hypothetical protein